MACNLSLHCGGPVDGRCPIASMHCAHPPAQSGEQSKIPGRTPLGEQQLIWISALDQQHAAHLRLLEGLKANTDVDQRALALAITNAQQAHMWAVLAVAKPTF